MTTSALPGQDLIERGLRDLAWREKTVAAFLVSIGAPRLRQLGYLIPDPLAEPELGLYALSRKTTPTPPTAATTRWCAGW